MLTRTIEAFDFARIEREAGQAARQALYTLWVALNEQRRAPALLGPARGGLGVDSSGWSGVPTVAAGTWQINDVLVPGRLLVAAAGQRLMSSAALTWDENAQRLTVTKVTATSEAQLPRKADPPTPTPGEIWVAGDLLKYRDDQGAPTTHTVARRSDPLSVFAPTSSAQLASVITDETGSGALVFGTSPNLSSPSLSDPTLSGTITGTPTVASAWTWNAGQTFPSVAITSNTGLKVRDAGTGGNFLTIAPGTDLSVDRTLTIATGDANRTITLTGDPTLVAGTMATTQGTLAQFAPTTSAQLASVITDETGSGALVFANSPTLVAPNLGTPSAINLANATNLPASSVVAGTFGAGSYAFVGGDLTVDNGTLFVSGATHRVGVGTTTPDPDVLFDANGRARFRSFTRTRLPVTAVGLVDVAPAAPSVTASSGTLVGGGPTKRGADSYWTTTTLGSTLTVDLGQVLEFSAIAFGTHWRLDSRWVPKAYTLLYSTDGQSYSTFATATGNTDIEVVHVSDVGVSARYIRLRIDAFQDGQSSANIAGLQILSTAGAAACGTPWALRWTQDAVLATEGNVSVGGVLPAAKLHVERTTEGRLAYLQYGTEASPVPGAMAFAGALQGLLVEQHTPGAGQWRFGLTLDHRKVGGTGNRGALDARLEVSGPATASDFFVGGGFFAFAKTAGNYFGANTYAQALPGAGADTHLYGAEFNTDMQVAGGDKVGLQVVDVASSTAAPAGKNIAIRVVAQPGAYAYQHGLVFDNHPQQGVRSSGTLILCTGGSYNLGLDLSAATFSTAAVHLGSGRIVATAWPTTAAAANTVVSDGDSIRRSTSSVQYKRDIRPLSPGHAASVLARLAPVTYVSRIPEDGERRWPGLVAEDVERVEPLLVANGSVMYDRVIVYLLAALRGLLRVLGSGATGDT